LPQLRRDGTDLIVAWLEEKGKPHFNTTLPHPQRKKRKERKTRKPKPKKGTKRDARKYDRLRWPVSKISGEGGG